MHWKVPTPDATEWKGVSGGVVGTFAPDLVMDTAGKSKEELEAVKEAKSAEPEEQAALAAFTDWKVRVPKLKYKSIERGRKRERERGREESRFCHPSNEESNLKMG